MRLPRLSFAPTPRAAIRGLPSSSRVRALILLWRSSRPLSLLAVIFVLAEGALPVLVLVAMGRVTGAIPGAVIFGLGSPAGHTLLVYLAEAGGIYALSLMRGPLEDALSAAATARVEAEMQRRLVAAVCAPVGIEHLEDREVLERLSFARGELLGGQPSSAPMALVSCLGDRLTGVLACVVLATFRWWLGLAVFVMWRLIRLPLGTRLRAQALRVRTAGLPLRRSWYLLGLAWKPAASKEMRVYGLGDWVSARHRDEWLEGTQPAWRELRRLANTAWGAGAAVLLLYGLAAGLLGYDAYHHDISLQTLAIMLPMLPSTMAVGSVNYSDIGLEKLLSAVPDLDGLTAGLAEVARRESGDGPATGLPLTRLRCEGVGFAYPGGAQPVLHGLDLELRVGESLGLVGVNGAGKTTLITLLARMREPTQGRITVDGEPLTGIDGRAWQRQVAVVYQDYARLPVSAADNVAMFAPAPDRDALDRAAARAGATGVIASLPRGWETILSPQFTGGVDLSGGQWQRIALARALYAIDQGARVLVLDEPTAQLDVRGEAAFYDQFLELTTGVTSIVISHRFASVRRANRIAVLDAGQITELGSHDALLAAGGTYAHMFNLQAERFRAREAAGAGGDGRRDGGAAT